MYTVLFNHVYLQKHQTNSLTTLTRLRAGATTSLEEVEALRSQTIGIKSLTGNCRSVLIALHVVRVGDGLVVVINVAEVGRVGLARSVIAVIVGLGLVITGLLRVVIRVVSPSSI